MTTVYGDLVRYRELFGNLFRRDVQAKYRGSLLGVAWTLANPVLLMAVYLLVFSVLWKTPFANGAGHYALFLLVAFGTRHLVERPARRLLETALALPGRWLGCLAHARVPGDFDGGRGREPAHRSPIRSRAFFGD